MEEKMVLICPRKYVQGKGVLSEAGKYAALVGPKALILWDAVVRQIAQKPLLDGLKAAGVEAVECMFNGQCTKAEAERVAGEIRSCGAKVVLGVGGGKILDTAKAAAAWTDIAMITVPTIASTDSPTSAATVWYDDDGNCVGWDCWKFNPEAVIVDTALIAQAPVRAFVAGMGDALSTWLECEAGHKSRPVGLSGGQATMASMAIARLCFETLLEWGIEAKAAVECKVVTPAVEKVVEANVLMSGLGFESGCLASSHAVANALSNLADCHSSMHGEKVGFGIVTQLCLDEEAACDEAYAIVDWMIEVDLPVCFADLGIQDTSREHLRPVAEAAAAEGNISHWHNFKVSTESILDAMYAADSLGRRRKAMA